MAWMRKGGKLLTIPVKHVAGVHVSERARELKGHSLALVRRGEERRGEERRGEERVRRG